MNPKHRTRTPSYRHHRPTGQAVARIDGRDYYLGRYGTDSSREKYDRIISEWLANGRRMPEPMQAQRALTIVELIVAYWKFAEGYYRKNGERTSELGSIRQSLRPLRRLYGSERAQGFGPLALKTVRHAMIRDGLARGTINRNVDRIKRMFKWATQNELVSPSAYHGLQTVESLKRGRSAARETEPVRPVPEGHISAVFPHVSKQVRAMIELQLVSGMRPGEVRLMRGCDLDTTGGVWVYVPESHKTEHHGIERRIYLGPQAQDVIRAFLKTDLNTYLFSPREAEESRNRKRRRNRRTPMTPSQAKRRPKVKPKRAPTACYTKDSYRQTIVRACKKADVPQWHPHQLRHNAATRLRKEYGLEIAQIILGHRSADVTQIYAERDQEKAKGIMARIG